MFFTMVACFHLRCYFKDTPRTPLLSFSPLRDLLRAMVTFRVNGWMAVVRFSGGPLHPGFFGFGDYGTGLMSPLDAPFPLFQVNPSWRGPGSDSDGGTSCRSLSLSFTGLYAVSAFQRSPSFCSSVAIFVIFKHRQI